MDEKNNNFQCSSLHGENFFHPNFRDLIATSSHLWLTHRIRCLKTFVLCVKDYFSQLDPSSHWISLVALSACPLLVKTPSKVRVILSLPLGCHILPSTFHEEMEQCSDPSLCGYKEECVISMFLEEMYADKWGLLIRDVDTAYRHLIAHSCLSHSIRYMYNRVCRASKMPPFIEMLNRLPYDSYLLSLVRDMTRFIMESSLLVKGPVMVHILTKPLIVNKESEWNVIQECRQICGFRWYGRYTKEVVIKFGSMQWVKHWNSTFVKNHLNVCFFEPWEERLIWVAVWLARLRSKMTCIEDSPKLLLFRFGILLS